MNSNKNKRDQKLAKWYQGKPCVVCRRLNTIGDHIIPFKRDKMLDKSINIWPLCCKHNDEKERKGLAPFVYKYSLGDYLERRGFVYFPSPKPKWVIPRSVIENSHPYEFLDEGAI